MIINKFAIYLYYLPILRNYYFKYLKEYQFIKKNQFKSVDHNLDIQKLRLYKLLKFSTQNISYYMNLSRENKLKLTKEKIFEDIKKFPILTKNDIRNHWKNLQIDSNINKKFLNTSGGTTGEPVKFVQDRNYRVLKLASKSLFNEMGNYYMGDKVIKLWGNEKEILNASKRNYDLFLNTFVKNIYFMNSFRMSDKIILNFIEELNQIKPKLIIAYVQSIYELARHIERDNLKIHQLKSIITSAGVLSREIKEFLEEIFNCTVFNRYGSREVGTIAMSCKKSEKLHTNMYQQYIEILDENDHPLYEGEKGRIIITDLSNYRMPLIRYEIGDTGSKNLSLCRCGRGLIRLNDVNGRIVDLFKTDKGELIDGEFFTHLFYFRNNIKKFQVIQKEINEIHINLVTLNKNKLEIGDELDLIQKIKIVMGNNCKVVFKYLNEIDPSSSGKFRYTISEI